MAIPKIVPERVAVLASECIKLQESEDIAMDQAIETVLSNETVSIKDTTIGEIREYLQRFKAAVAEEVNKQTTDKTGTRVYFTVTGR